MKRLTLLLASLLILLLAACAAPEAEPPASQSEPEPTSDVPALSPVEMEEDDATKPAAKTPAGADSEPVSPVTVDLRELTPEPTAEQGEVREMPMPGSPNMKVAMAEKARQALAERLKIDVSQVALVEMNEVNWRNSSLGCPEPGMMYLQVIVPGTQIVLSAGGQKYYYHTNADGSQMVYCANPQPLDEGATPSDQ